MAYICITSLDKIIINFKLYYLWIVKRVCSKAVIIGTCYSFLTICLYSRYSIIFYV